MRLQFIKDPYLAKLKKLPKSEWLENFTNSSKKPWLHSFFNNSKWIGDTGIDVLEENLLLPQNASPDKDGSSAERLYALLKDKITPAQAADPRLWTYLSHETCWDYMIKRWNPAKIQAGGKTTDIERRYFVKGTAIRSFTRHGIARLWWLAHLTYDRKRNDPYELTKVLFRDQNIQHHLLERNFGMNRNVLHAILDIIKDDESLFLVPNVQTKMLNLGKLINRWGGVRMLDHLSKEDIQNYVLGRKNIFNC